jgi:hypothetical protein
MDLAKVLSELRQELADLDAAIESLEQIQQERPTRGQRSSKVQADAGGEEQTPLPAAAEANGRSRDSA